jgi:hypothetical protein
MANATHTGTRPTAFARALLFLGKAELIGISGCAAPIPL